MTDQRYFTTTQLAQYLGVSRWTVARRPELQRARVRVAGRYRYDITRVKVQA